MVRKQFCPPISFPPAATAPAIPYTQTPSNSPGSIIITTPHILAIKDATRGVAMFEKVGVPILGLVRNMSVFRCPSCGAESHVFGGEHQHQPACGSGTSTGAGGGKGTGMDNIPLLADVPLHPSIADDSRAGKPTVVSEPEGSERVKVFFDIARTVAGKIGL